MLAGERWYSKRVKKHVEGGTLLHVEGGTLDFAKIEEAYFARLKLRNCRNANRIVSF